MKKLNNLKGAKVLSRKEQQLVKGGKIMCKWGPNGQYCSPPYVCINGTCVLAPE